MPHPDSEHGRQGEGWGFWLTERILFYAMALVAVVDALFLSYAALQGQFLSSYNESEAVVLFAGMAVMWRRERNPGQP